MQENLDGIAEDRQVSLQERIKNQIEWDIVNGKRLPGSAIDEKEIAATFHVSRTPVREALIALSVLGLVIIVPRSGVYVRKASLTELVCALETICEIEGVVAGLAAKRATQFHTHAMRVALMDGGRAADAQNIEGYRDANSRLHNAIYDAGGNPILTEHINNSRSMLVAHQCRRFEMPGRLQVSHREHGRIVSAIEQGDAALATASMREHISRGGEAMIALLTSAQECA